MPKCHSKVKKSPLEFNFQRRDFPERKSTFLFRFLNLKSKNKKNSNQKYKPNLQYFFFLNLHFSLIRNAY